MKTNITKMNNFLNKDQKAALEEKVCIIDNLLLMKLYFRKKDYKSASVVAENIKRSFESLDSMQRDKRTQDKWEKMKEKIDEGSIDVNILRRWMH